MARRKLSDAEILQVVGMIMGGMSYRENAEQFIGHCSIEAAREPHRECKRTPTDRKGSENDSKRR